MLYHLPEMMVFYVNEMLNSKRNRLVQLQEILAKFLCCGAFEPIE